MVALGLLKRIMGLPEDQVNKTIEEDEELVQLKENLSAIEAGEHLFFEFPFPELSLSPTRDYFPKVILHGSGAIAKAAVRAGCRAFFGYPITPASEIMQEMQEELSRTGGVFLQTENEIASAGMSIGASLVGVESMTATSGPGFDLMTEIMGMASVTEIPIVIVDVQRCGPSTGIPSKTEQSDLNHAIYGGHGDAPRVVIAPCDVEGCYRLTIVSINIAQYFQTPVILLSDQWLGQTIVATNSEFMKKDYPMEQIKKPVGEYLEHYQRYRLTEDFISPMAAVGDEGLVYQTTGLTHNEMGAPAFDFETHQKMHEKRWKKLLPLRQRDELVKVFGDQKLRKGIITWGSSAQTVIEIVNDMELLKQVKVCVPELLHPLPHRVESFLRSVEQLLVIEMNYSGQLHRYLRSQVDLPQKTRVYTRAGSRPFSKKELTDPIIEIAK
jgi:2-oxoglutarate ferredoxin oxidoreductase subunit alpha